MLSGEKLAEFSDAGVLALGWGSRASSRPGIVPSSVLSFAEGSVFFYWSAGIASITEIELEWTRALDESEQKSYSL